MTMFSVAWSHRRQALSRLERAAVTPLNDDLVIALLGVGGRFLRSVVERPADDVGFSYRLRAEQPGFVKLDLQTEPFSHEPIIGGCDLTLVPEGRFAGMAERFYQAAGWGSFVPATVFGVFGRYGFYVESLYSFTVVEPFFVRASHEFLALLLSQYEQAHAASYLHGLATGRDPDDLIAREPLLRAIVAEMPGDVRPAFFGQLSTELSKILRQPRR